MKTELHKAITRGHAEHGWLESYHTFSFAGYHDPKRIHFGALRVLNDDRVAGGMGFGTHPHDNMEIISIPLSGALTHKDSMGNEGIIRKGDIQVMSAGSGIRHSELNGSANEEVRFLQLWVFPDRKNVRPRYDQITVSESELKNNWCPIIGSFEHPAKTWIYQDVLFSLGKLEAGYQLPYSLFRKEHGVYAFVIEGEGIIAGESVARRDGLAITQTDSFSATATTPLYLLLAEVPLFIS